MTDARHPIADIAAQISDLMYRLAREWEAAEEDVEDDARREALHQALSKGYPFGGDIDYPFGGDLEEVAAATAEWAEHVQQTMNTALLRSDADDATLAGYHHTPGSPVLDRPAALLSIRQHGQPGAAINTGDEVAVYGTDEAAVVTGTFHGSGNVTVRLDTSGADRTLPGTEVTVTAKASAATVPDDYLAGLTLEQARLDMAVVASDNGRFPQYHNRYFDGWTFARANQGVRHRGETILIQGQRCLARTDGDLVFAWITRTDGVFRSGRSVAVPSNVLDFESRDFAQVVADTHNANQRL